MANYVPNATKWNGIDFREVKCVGDCAICTPKDIGLKKGQDPDEGQDLDAKYIANPDSSTKTEVRLIKPGMIVHLLLKLQVYLESTLTNGNNHTPRVFSTKTQDFTPMCLKPVVEVQLFL